ncbi:MAG: T9SS type A sorting domain-containing protein, partial [Mariniphaga sp.]
VTATIVVTPTFTNAGVSCSGPAKTFTITVNPTAQVNAISGQVLCNGSATTAVNFGTVSAGGTTTYAWINSDTTIGLAANGSGDIGAFTAINTGTAPVTATIVVTPTFTNAGVSCSGPAKTFTITVNPTAQIFRLSSQELCNRSATTAILFNTINTGGTTTYSWTNTDATIGLASNGSGNIPSFTAVNTGNNEVTATIIVTPTYANAGVSCTGPSRSFTILVNPTPAAPAGSDRIICQKEETSLGASNVSGSTYSWTSAPTGFTSSGANPTVSPMVTTTFTLTETITATGCASTNSVIVTVNPIPAAVAGADRIICLNTGTILGASPVSGSTYSWSSVPSGYISAAANPTVNPTITTTYTVLETVTSTGCSNSNSVVVTVRPLYFPTITGLTTVCAGTAGVVYRTDAVMTDYKWTLPPGAKIISGAGTDVVVVDFSATASLGFVVVSGISECGYFTISNNYSVAVNPIPTTPRIIEQGHTLISSADSGNQWYLDSNPIATGGTEKQYAALVSGNYTVTQTINNCESLPSYVFALSDISASDIEMTVYPNPNHGQFNLKIQSGKPVELMIDISNNNGKLLWRQEKVAIDRSYLTPVDLINIPGGIYMIRVHNSKINKAIKVIITK